MEIKQLRKLEAEELTAHDVVSLVVLAGLCANPNMVDIPFVQTARGIADQFLLQREAEKGAK